MTLAEAMPHEFSGPEYVDAPAQKFKDVLVIRVFRRTAAWMQWPGPHKNVHMWVMLANNKAVGFNENPNRGWSFPVARLKKMQ